MKIWNHYCNNYSHFISTNTLHTGYNVTTHYITNANHLGLNYWSNLVFRAIGEISHFSANAAVLSKSYDFAVKNVNFQWQFLLIFLDAIASQGIHDIQVTPYVRHRVEVIF